MSPAVGFTGAGMGLLLVVLLGGPLALLWGAGACGAIGGGIAYVQRRDRDRQWREAGRRQRERAEQARLARIRRERERTLRNRNRPQPQPTGSGGGPGPDERIVTPSNCTPQCFGASKPDPDQKCGCPCNGAHHGEGHRLRAERRRARRKAGTSNAGP